MSGVTFVASAEAQNMVAPFWSCKHCELTDPSDPEQTSQVVPFKRLDERDDRKEALTKLMEAALVPGLTNYSGCPQR